MRAAAGLAYRISAVSRSTRNNGRGFSSTSARKRCSLARSSNSTDFSCVISVASVTWLPSDVSWLESSTQRPPSNSTSIPRLSARSIAWVTRSTHSSESPTNWPSKRRMRFTTWRTRTSRGWPTNLAGSSFMLRVSAELQATRMPSASTMEKPPSRLSTASWNSREMRSRSRSAAIRSLRSFMTATKISRPSTVAREIDSSIGNSSPSARRASSSTRLARSCVASPETRRSNAAS